jgi:hypothetical protein
VNTEQLFLVDTLLAHCARLDDVEQVPLSYMNDIGRTCAMLRPLVADADTPEQLALQNLVWCTEEWVLTWTLRGCYTEADMPPWLLGDVDADFVAWTAARVEYDQLAS